jgi:hypothetical protein
VITGAAQVPEGAGTAPDDGSERKLEQP